MTRIRTSLVALAALALAAVPVKASDPIGVYCVVDKVVLEPNDTEPLNVQVWGAFAFATRQPNGTAIYGPVQKGYLYFTCPNGQERACLNEWADLKSVAGTKQVVGFGSRYTSVPTAANAGRLRPANERPVRPEPYPINIGVVKLGGPNGRNPETLAPLTSVQGLNYAETIKRLQVETVR